MLAFGHVGATENTRNISGKCAHEQNRETENAAFEGSNGILSVTTKETTAHGRVVYINEAHRYFTAEVDLNGKKLKRCAGGVWAVGASWRG